MLITAHNGWQLPKLIAVEQQAESGSSQKERQVSVGGPSGTGRKRLNAMKIKQALPNTKLVDAAWLTALADAGGMLPRCQDLPAEAVVTLEEMQQMPDKPC